MKHFTFLIVVLVISTLACTLEINTDDDSDTDTQNDDSQQLSVDCPDPIEYVEEPTPTPYGVLSITPSQQADGCVYMEPNTTVTISLPDAPEGFFSIEFWYCPDNPETLRCNVIGMDDDSSDGASVTFDAYENMYGYVYVQGVADISVSNTGFSNEPLLISTRQN